MPLTKHCRIRRQKLLIVKDNFSGNKLHLTNFEIEEITNQGYIFMTATCLLGLQILNLIKTSFRNQNRNYNLFARK